jgi:hypothetical protein
MRRNYLSLTFAAFAMSCSTSIVATPNPVTTSKQACALLKIAAVVYHLSRRNPSGRYYCEPIGDNSEYFLLGLRYRITKDELVGSNLLGWFAIRRSDSVVCEWDMNESKAFPLRPRPAFEN